MWWGLSVKELDKVVKLVMAGVALATAVVTVTSANNDDSISYDIDSSEDSDQSENSDNSDSTETLPEQASSASSEMKLLFVQLLAPVQILLEAEFRKGSPLDEALRLAASEQQVCLNCTVEQVITRRKLLDQLVFRSYTFENPNLYSEFNALTRNLLQHQERRELRHAAYNELGKSAFWQLMYAAFYRQERQSYRVLYRGVRMKFRASENAVKCFNQFTSATENFEIALEFAGNQRSTLFIIHDASGVPMAGRSAFPGEREVLLSPFQRYQVESQPQNLDDYPHITVIIIRVFETRRPRPR